MRVDADLLLEDALDVLQGAHVVFDELLHALALDPERDQVQGLVRISRVLAIVVKLASNFVLLELELDLDVFHGRVIEPLKLQQELLFLKLDLVFSGLAIVRELQLKCE